MNDWIPRGLRPLLLATAVAFVAGCTTPAPRVAAAVAAAVPPAPIAAAPAAPAVVAAPVLRDVHAVPAYVDELEHRTFNYFWELGNPRNGLVPDRWPTPSFSSIAAVGFGLSAYGVGVERGWIARDQAIERTLATLRFFDAAPQGDAATGVTGYKGFFYHFLDMQTGLRFENTELSTVDTSLLLGGVLFAQSYFDRADPREAEIRALAERIYRRVDWNWAQPRGAKITMGWIPGKGMHADDWRGYNEAQLVYLLALGSPTHPVDKAAYDGWVETYDKTWGTFYGQEHLSFPPLFGHQYTPVWYDLRGVQDDYMRRRGIDYFENSRRATLSQRAYAIANPGDWEGYGADIWGLTASDGPADAKFDFRGKVRQLHTYTARGAGLEYILDDGTIVPTAAIGSMPFAPEIVLPAVQAMMARYPQAYQKYGFVDAFNPSVSTADLKLQHGRVVGGVWVDKDYLGIDQGPILLMIENHRSGFVWDVMRRNPHVVRGMRRAGFRGGWLDALPPAADLVGAVRHDPPSATGTAIAAEAAPAR
jgi:hypothetical protein